MTDGKKRAGSVLAVVVDEVARTLVFNVATGEHSPGLSITLALANVSAANCAYAALHGFKQRITDMAALSRNPETGLAVTPQEKFDAIKRGVDHYMSGTDDWNMRVAGGERQDSGIALLVRALNEIYPAKTADELRAWVKSKSKADQLALKQSEKIKPLIDGYLAESTAGVDADALLGELV